MFADIVLLNSSFKEAVVAFIDIYYSYIGTQNTKLASLIIQVEKTIDLLENFFKEVKGFLGDMKDTLGNI